MGKASGTPATAATRYPPAAKTIPTTTQWISSISRKWCPKPVQQELFCWGSQLRSAERDRRRGEKEHFQDLGILKGLLGVGWGWGQISPCSPREPRGSWKSTPSQGGTSGESKHIPKPTELPNNSITMCSCVSSDLQRPFPEFPQVENAQKRCPVPFSGGGGLPGTVHLTQGHTGWLYS